MGDASYQFSVEKHDIVKQGFRKVGLSLPIDGSADDDLDTKGFHAIDVGDWTRAQVSEDDENLYLNSGVDNLHQLADLNIEYCRWQ